MVSPSPTFTPVGSYSHTHTQTDREMDTHTDMHRHTDTALKHTLMHRNEVKRSTLFFFLGNFHFSMMSESQWTSR